MFTPGTIVDGYVRCALGSHRDTNVLVDHTTNCFEETCAYVSDKNGAELIKGDGGELWLEGRSTTKADRSAGCAVNA